MIAMATACNPKLLIADEPTTALDVTIQKQILDLLMKLQAEHGMGLIMITHNMGVVAETADRVLVQYKGRKMEEAGVLELFESPKSPYTQALLSALPEKRGGRPAADHPGLLRRRARDLMAELVLEARDLKRDYHVGRGIFRSARTVHALKGVSFKLERGRTLAVVGESGCGKSTLARILTMIDRPDLGRAPDRRPADRHRARRDQGDAPQGADRLPEPLRLAQSAPEDRRRARRAAADQHQHPGHRAARPRDGDAAQGRPQARALQPLSAHVLGRPAPAHRDRPGADPQPLAARARRAGLRPRPLGPGADPQPASATSRTSSTSPTSSSATT